MNFEADALFYTVVVNHEGQYSIHPFGKALPSGWTETTKSGTQAECLDYIDTLWTDITPLTVKG
jgi:MbtH protein